MEIPWEVHCAPRMLVSTRLRSVRFWLLESSARAIPRREQRPDKQNWVRTSIHKMSKFNSTKLPDETCELSQQAAVLTTCWRGKRKYCTFLSVSRLGIFKHNADPERICNASHVTHLQCCTSCNYATKLPVQSSGTKSSLRAERKMIGIVRRPS